MSVFWEGQEVIPVWVSLTELTACPNPTLDAGNPHATSEWV